jgi:hypothetical protein
VGSIPTASTISLLVGPSPIYVPTDQPRETLPVTNRTRGVMTPSIESSAVLS